MIGFFPLPERRICFDTGLNSETVKNLLNKFQDDYDKIFYDHEWIFLKNTIKFQNINNSKIKKGVTRLFKDLQNDKFKTVFIANLYELNYNSLAADILNETNFDYESYISDDESSMTNDKVSISDDESGMSLDVKTLNKTLNKTLIKTTTSCCKKDDSSDDENVEPDGSVVVEEKEEEKTITDQVDNQEYKNLSQNQGIDDTLPREKSKDSSAERSKEFDTFLEFPPFPAKLKHFDLLKSKFSVIQETQNSGIPVTQIISLYNQNPVIDLTRWWLWAREKSKTNTAGLFLTFVSRLAENVPKDILDKISDEFTRLINSERLYEERKRRKA
jgi:hypothetical protein